MGMDKLHEDEESLSDVGDVEMPGKVTPRDMDAWLADDQP